MEPLTVVTHQLRTCVNSSRWPPINTAECDQKAEHKATAPAPTNEMHKEQILQRWGGSGSK
eukprot:882568-Amphidinium_carterae.1